MVIPRADWREAAEFPRAGDGQAEEIERGWNLFEQPAGPDLDFAAAGKGGGEKRRLFLLHDHLADEG